MMQWLIELVGPQHSGKTTIADLLSFTLEESRIPALRVETDNYVYSLFPTYVRLKATGQLQRAHRLLAKRWPLVRDVVATVIRKGLTGGFTVIHDHVNTSSIEHGVDRTLAKESGAEYLGVLVTAPLEVLQERWRQSEIPDVKLERMKRTFEKFQVLHRESRFQMALDTSIISAEEAAGGIISKIQPGLDVKRIHTEQSAVRKPVLLESMKPQMCVENLQILKSSDSYIIVHRHRRYVTDGTGLKILNLCDGRNSVEAISERAGTDLDTAMKTVEFLYRSDMVTV